METVDDADDVPIGVPPTYRSETNGWLVSQIDSGSLVQLDAPLVVVELLTLEDGDDQLPEALA